MPDDRCEVVLYTSNHDSSLAELSTSNVKKIVDLWANRTNALMSRGDVQNVLIFENRGREVGALSTIHTGKFMPLITYLKEPRNELITLGNQILTQLDASSKKMGGQLG